MTRTELVRKATRPLPALMLYGAAMGSYGIINNSYDSFLDALLHLLFASSKIPLLIGLTFLIALPSFYVFYMLAGLAEDFRKILRMLIESNAIFALALGSLAPITLLFYLSTPDYLSAVLFNGAMFGAAAAMRQTVLRIRFRPLVMYQPRHRFLLRIWFLLYAFVGTQTGWVLRPWIGVPGGGVGYFREDTWSNAYVEVGKIIRAVLGF